jgi:hypothetical protein
VVHALELISAAVDRYCDLTGGAYCGHSVERVQVIEGVSFIYSPPPRAAVPFAAALRGHDRWVGGRAGSGWQEAAAGG